VPRPIDPGTKLARLIIATGRPAYQIAGEANLKDWQLSAYYHGRTRPPMLHLRRICAVLECDPDDVLEEHYTSDDQLAGART
jgi:hypothetical protein